MNRIVFAPAAKVEVREAAAWYGERSPRLGRELIGEVRRQIALIRAHPRAFAHASIPAVDFRVRRAVCNRFPYALFYRERIQGIEILAVSHTSRQPGYWRARI